MKRELLAFHSALGRYCSSLTDTLLFVHCNAAAAPTSFYDFKVKNLKGQDWDLNQEAGKVLLLSIIIKISRVFN